MSARSSLAKFARAYAAKNPEIAGRVKPPKVPGVNGSRKRDLEGEFLLLLRAHGIAVGATQFRFHPTRQWRFDLAWPSKKFAVEIDGGLFSGKAGGHSSPAGIRRDYEKDTAALVLGWRVFRIHDGMVKKMDTIDVIRQFVGDGSGEAQPAEQSELKLT